MRVKNISDGISNMSLKGNFIFLSSIKKIAENVFFSLIHARSHLYD